MILKHIDHLEPLVSLKDYFKMSEIFKGKMHISKEKFLNSELNQMSSSNWNTKMNPYNPNSISVSKLRFYPINDIPGPWLNICNSLRKKLMKQNSLLKKLNCSPMKPTNKKSRSSLLVLYHVLVILLSKMKPKLPFTLNFSNFTQILPGKSKWVRIGIK